MFDEQSGQQYQTVGRGETAAARVHEGRNGTEIAYRVVLGQVVTKHRFVTVHVKGPCDDVVGVRVEALQRVYSFHHGRVRPVVDVNVL